MASIPARRHRRRIGPCSVGPRASFPVLTCFARSTGSQRPDEGRTESECGKGRSTMTTMNGMILTTRMMTIWMTILKTQMAKPSFLSHCCRDFPSRRSAAADLLLHAADVGRRIGGQEKLGHRGMIKCVLMIPKMMITMAVMAKRGLETAGKTEEKGQVHQEIEEEAARVDLSLTANGQPRRSHPGSLTTTTSSTYGLHETAMLMTTINIGAMTLVVAAIGKRIADQAGEEKPILLPSLTLWKVSSEWIPHILTRKPGSMKRR
mmetsp:Transcript_24609/g.70951  ORF Transcript_24609/g.70951 Transcript_24609/m.70951 type:complete len:263 (+) Transcript_24609:919-1707(+)